METKTPAEAATPQPATAGEQSNSEVVQTTTEAAAASGSTTTAPSPTPAKGEGESESADEQPRVKGAVDVETYEKMRRDALKPAPAKPAEKSPEVVKDEGAAEEGEETSDVQRSTSNDSIPEPEAEPAGKTPDRLRIGRLNEQDKKRLANAVAIAADEGIPLDEAMARLTGKATGKAADTTASTGAEAEADVPKLRTQAEIDADLAALDAEYEKAGDDLDTKAMVQLRKRERELTREAAQVSEAAKEAQARQATQFQQTVESSQAEAVKFYPDASKKGTPLYDKITEIAQRLEDSGNPLIYQADSPLKVAQMAANELGIAPADPNKKAADTAATTGKVSPSTATKPAPVNQTAVSRSTQPAAAPASGAARTSHGNGSTPIDFGKIQTVHDYDKLKEELLGHRV